MRRKTGYTMRLVVVLGMAMMRTVNGQQQPQMQTTGSHQVVDTSQEKSQKAQPQGPRPQSPAAHYSPLAAAGGYQVGRETWYDALFHSLNPRNIDWGMRWEQRRAIFLENTIGNRYFVFCAFLVLCFYATMVAIGWVVWDHRKDIRYFETELVKGRNWAEYWKGRAIEAISRHNQHVERCNRVVEAEENGAPGGDAAEASDLRLQLERTRTELQNVTSEKLRLKGELEEKARTISDLSMRVDDVTRRIANGTPGNGSAETGRPEERAALVARINRLESALAAATQENRRLKGA